MTFTLVVEWSAKNYAAHAPELPGRVATGSIKDLTLLALWSAIEPPTRSLPKTGEPVPPPGHAAAVVDVAA